MTTINTYLRFNGNCEAAFLFYKTVFGGEFQHLGRFAEMPPQEGMPPVPDADKDKVMHVTLPIGGETILMGSDTMAPWNLDFNAGNNFSISIHTDSKEEADRLFTALSDQGKVMMPMNQTFWGSYFGMFTDQFGISWMINVDLNKQ
jgi:PhnB protein